MHGDAATGACASSHTCVCALQFACFQVRDADVCLSCVSRVWRACSVSPSPSVDPAMSGPLDESIPSGREESILAHTQLLSLHLAANTHDGGASGASPAPSASVLALQQQIAAYLPSREWFKIPMDLSVETSGAVPSAVASSSLHLPSSMYVSRFSLQHGLALPPLDVRVLPHHCVCDEASARELDASLSWLLESIGHGSSYPVLGVDCECDCSIDSDGEVRLLQLSTGTRCILIRVPPQSILKAIVGAAELDHSIGASFTHNSHGHAQQQQHAHPPSPLFTPFFHQLMSNRSIFKSGVSCTQAQQYARTVACALACALKREGAGDGECISSLCCTLPPSMHSPPLLSPCCFSLLCRLSSGRMLLTYGVAAADAR
jgi:hypothetical protein